MTEAAATAGGRLRTVADAADLRSRTALEASGFEVVLVNESFRVPFEVARAHLRRSDPSPGFHIITADLADEQRLFTLDTTLRQDVPGTDGWRGDREWFRQELAEAPPFDPSAYLVAVDGDNGEYAGLVRMWRNPDGPRLGLVGVARQYRSTTLGAILLARVVEVAAGWGYDAFDTGTSPSNSVIHPRMRRIGAELIGRSLVLRWRGSPRPG